MKNYSHSFIINKVRLADAFGLVFDNHATLNAVHGRGNWEATRWSDNKRNVKFEMDPSGIPSVVVKIIGKGKIMTDVRQTVQTTPGVITVGNKFRPKVIGAEAVRVRSMFTLTDVGDATKVAVSCDVCAILPPPFKGLAEGFMKRTAEASFSWLEAAILVQELDKRPALVYEPPEKLGGCLAKVQCLR
jgi:hypothetical protein